MDTQHLIDYFKGQLSEEESEAVKSWLAADTDGSRARQYRRAHLLFCGLVMHEGEAPAARRTKWSIPATAIRYAAIAAVFVCCVLATALITENVTTGRLAGQMETVSVPVGNSVRFTLSDGTEMWLRGGATVKYPSVFSKKTRNVSVVGGEVLFDVAKDENKPFIVETFASDIKVLGTRFNVVADEKHGEFSASLLRGSIQVSNRLEEGESIVLTTNQMVEMVDNHLRIEEIEDAAAIDCWTTGFIDIVGVPFDRLMKRLETVYGVNIEIERETLPEIRYTWGKIRITYDLDEALTLLARASDFTWETDRKTGTVIIR